MVPWFCSPPLVYRAGLYEAVGSTATKQRAERPPSLRSFILAQNSSRRDLAAICAAREQLQPKSLSTAKSWIFSRARP